jgi:hypothetical protein
MCHQRAWQGCCSVRDNAWIREPACGCMLASRLPLMSAIFLPLTLPLIHVFATQSGDSHQRHRAVLHKQPAGCRPAADERHPHARQRCRQQSPGIRGSDLPAGQVRLQRPLQHVAHLCLHAESHADQQPRRPAAAIQQPVLAPYRGLPRSMCIIPNARH